jgi:hypothetical protein
MAFARLCLVVLVLGVVAGCGGDDESSGKATAPQTQPAPKTATETERTNTVTVPSGRTETQTSTSPEKQPGGAGDEEPAHSQALFTGRGGRVRPAVVRVPAFIAIRVELRSADGATYGLRFGSRTLRADRDVSSVSASFAGLRPGKTLTGVPVGGGNRVRVEATAEPGP